MKPIEKKLLKYFSRLTTDQQQNLLQFAEFLLTKNDGADEEAEQEIPQPVIKERPDKETVVGAIKRLTSSYPMLEKDKLFNETSILMTKHVMQGHDANLVIDELEMLFQKHYEELVNNLQDDSQD